MGSSSVLATCLVNPGDGQILAVDARIAGWVGLAAENLAGQPVERLLPGLNSRLVEIGGPSPAGSRLETNLDCSPNSQLPVSILVTPLTSATGRLWLVTIRLAKSPPGPLHLDALTGLPDRRELHTCYERWRQTAKRVPHAVLFMDLDNFKAVNDNHGHRFGDQVLCALAKRWQCCVREGDLIARYGGDEFVVLVADVASPAEVEPIAARLADSTARPVRVGNTQMSITVSVGIATAPDVVGDLDQLIAMADQAMYKAKRGDAG